MTRPKSELLVDSTRVLATKSADTTTKIATGRG
jgi:hypothetical protein